MSDPEGNTTPEVGESILLTILESIIGAFAVATVLYHLWLLLDLSTKGFLWVTPLLLVPAGVMLRVRRQNWRGRGNLADDWRFLSGAALVAAGIASSTLFIAHERGDDIQYFYRGLLQAKSFEQPFIATIEHYDIAGLRESAVAYVPSYEPLAGLAARAVRIDPLAMFHVVVPFLWGLVWTLVYLLTYREIGLSRFSAVCATAIAYLFLFLDGNLNRSFGTSVIMKFGHGKAMMWSVCVPFVIFYAWRWFRSGSAASWWGLFSVAIAAAGLSGSGLFLVPAMIAAVTLTHLLSERSSKTHILRAFLINVCSSYSVVLLLLMIIGVLPTYDLSGYYSQWPSTWDTNLALVISGRYELIRDAVILLLLPLTCLDVRSGRRLALVSISAGLLYLNPWLGPLWLEALTPGAYWRLAYLLPLPLCAGLMGSGLAANRGMARKISAVAAAALAFVMILSQLDRTVLDIPSAFLKNPGEYRFLPDRLQFSLVAGEMTTGKHLLAPDGIVRVLPLIHPAVRLEAAREDQTEIDFDKSGMREEGMRRTLAQTLVTKCDRSPEAREAFRQSIANGVDAVIVRECKEQKLRKLLRFIDETGEWTQAYRSQGYLLLLLRDDARGEVLSSRSN